MSPDARSPSRQTEAPMRRRFCLLALVLMVAVLGAAACGAKQPATSEGNAPGIPALSGKVQHTKSGLGYIDEQVGTGATPQNGQTVSVHYTGWLTNGTKFDS